jgi:hypothetical protein
MGDQALRGNIDKLSQAELKAEFKKAVGIILDTQAGHFGEETCECSACNFLRKWAGITLGRPT